MNQVLSKTYSDQTASVTYGYDRDWMISSTVAAGTSQSIQYSASGTNTDNNENVSSQQLLVPGSGHQHGL